MRGPILCPICHQPQSVCVRPHGAAYTVVNLRTQERGTFRDAHDVAMYMWGRDFERYQILKNGVAFDWQDGAFEQALEAI